MLKTKCLCPSTFTHEQCLLDWFTAKGDKQCDVCEQQVETFRVDWRIMSSHSTDEVKKRNKMDWILRCKS